LTPIYSKKTYITGERISIADIILATTLTPVLQNPENISTFAPFINLQRWFSTLINQTNFLVVQNTPLLSEKASHSELEDIRKAAQDDIFSKPISSHHTQKRSRDPSLELLSKEDASSTKKMKTKKTAIPKLYTNLLTTIEYQILIAAKYGNIQLDFVNGVDPKSNQYKSKFAQGLDLPALETESGILYGTSTIARHVCRISAPQLLGSTPSTTALVDEWAMFAITQIAPYTLPLSKVNPAQVSENDRSFIALNKALSVLNERLLSKTFIASERITLADISLIVSIVPIYHNLFKSNFGNTYPNVKRWFNTVANQPQVSELEQWKSLKVI